ncbi:universal stress protein [Guyparkeria sp. 1SP6A2]|nr:universal stress protein [Guyparkeria sp. 1SP6A2]
MDDQGAIVVLLDSSPASTGALTTAARLARRQDSELVALFIEDNNLSRSAEYAFVREISALSGNALPFDAQTLTNRLRHQREHIAALLEEEASRGALRWRLQVASGGIHQTTSRAAAETGAELIVLGKAGWSAGRGARLGSTARQLLLETGCSLMLWEGRQPLGDDQAEDPVQALIMDPAETSAIVRAATALALASEHPLQLLVSRTIDPSRLRSLVAELERLSITVTTQTLIEQSLRGVAHALHTQPGSELVIGRHTAELLGCNSSDLITLATAPVLVVS